MLFFLQIDFTGIGRNSFFMYYSSILCKLFEVSCCYANCVRVYMNTCIYLVRKLKIWTVYVLVKFPCLSSPPVWFPRCRLIPELCCSGTPPPSRVCPRPRLPATSSTWSAPRRAGEVLRVAPGRGGGCLDPRSCSLPERPPVPQPCFPRPVWTLLLQ